MNVPGAQSSQVALPAAGARLPGRQSRQTEAFELPGIGLALPGAHAWHEALLDRPRSGLKVPASHGSKVWRALAAPVAPQKPPAGHSSQVVEFGLSLNFPASQAEQFAFPERALYVPAGQGMQLSRVLAPSEGMYVPIGHSSGVLHPSESQ